MPAVNDLHVHPDVGAVVVYVYLFPYTYPILFFFCFFWKEAFIGGSAQGQRQGVYVSIQFSLKIVAEIKLMLNLSVGMNG